MSLKHYLFHDKLLVRFLALLTVAAVFVVVWGFAYTLLPDGVLRGGTGGAALAGSHLAAACAWEAYGVSLAVAS